MTAEPDPDAGAAEAQARLAEQTEDPVDELIAAPAPDLEPVLEPAVETGPEPAPAQVPPAAATPRSGDFDLFYDDDLGIEPESFDIEAPLIQRAPAAPSDDVVLDEPLPDEIRAGTVPATGVAGTEHDDATEPDDGKPEDRAIEPDAAAEEEGAALPGTIVAPVVPDDATTVTAATVGGGEEQPTGSAVDVDAPADPAMVPTTEPTTDAGTAVTPDDTDGHDQPDEDDESDEDGPSDPGAGPEGPDDDPDPGDVPTDSGAALDTAPALEGAPEEPEPMTYAWALAELTAEHEGSDTPSGRGPAVQPDAEATPPPRHESGPEPPDAEPDEAGAADAPDEAGAADAPDEAGAVDAPDEAGAADTPDGADAVDAGDEPDWSATPWSPTWEPTDTPAQAGVGSAASPAATATAPSEVELIPTPQDTAAAAEHLTVTSDGEEIPPFVEYRPSELRRYLLGALFVATSLLAVLAIFYAVQQGGTAPAVTATAVTVLAGAFWWGLLSWAPTIISISRGILEIAQGPNSERFDLTDRATEVHVGDDARSRSWRTTVARANGTTLVIRAGQVRPQQFSTIVRHYREQAERTA